MSGAGEHANPHFLQAESLCSVEPSGPKPSGVALGQATQQRGANRPSPQWGTWAGPIQTRPLIHSGVSPSTEYYTAVQMQHTTSCCVQVCMQHDGKCFGERV